MTTRKNSKRKRNNNSVQIIHKRKNIKSNSGILPIIDVKNQEGLKGFIERIMKGPVTIVMVYAPWCGHCQAMDPIFKKAANIPGRTCQTVALNHEFLDSANSLIKTNVNSRAQKMKVDGYPTLLVLNNQGVPIATPEPVKNQSVIESLMKESGTAAKEAGVGSLTPTANIYAASTNENTSESNGQLPNAIPMPTVQQIQNDSMNVNNNSMNVINNSNDSIHLNNPENRRPMVGGLYGTLAQSAYTIAPAAVLVAAAASIFKKKTKGTKGTKRSKRTKKRSHRRK